MNNDWEQIVFERVFLGTKSEIGLLGKSVGNTG